MKISKVLLTTLLVTSIGCTKDSPKKNGIQKIEIKKNNNPSSDHCPSCGKG